MLIIILQHPIEQKTSITGINQFSWSKIIVKTDMVILIATIRILMIKKNKPT